MLNPFGSYIAAHRGRTKEMRRARIVAHVAGADWTVMLEDTGGVVAATSLPTLTYTTAQLVYVSRISAAGAPNAGFIIMGGIDNAMPPAPPVTDTHSAETITRIVPENVTLPRDGTPVTVTIYGVGLVTAPTYGSADIVDDSAPVITPTQITLSVRCDAPYGAADTYSFTVAGRTIADYFTLPAAAAPAAPEPAGMASSFVGGTYGSTDATGAAAKFRYPAGVVVDGSGNVYVADWTNCTIRKVTPAGAVTTPVGSAWVGGHTDGTGSAARFLYPVGLALDNSGNLFVADKNNATIRKVDLPDVVTTFAGVALTGGTADGTGSAARFGLVYGMAIDAAGNLYVSDSSNHTIRKITSGAVVTTLAGLGESSGTDDGTGSAARFNSPDGIAVDPSGNLYVCDSLNHTIRKVTPGGVVTTLAGSAGLTGTADGTGSAARFNRPAGIAIHTSGNLYVADSYNHSIRRVTPAGEVTTVCGLPGTYGSADGTGTVARFYYPWGLAFDSAGVLYVADYFNNKIRKIA